MWWLALEWKGGTGAAQYQLVHVQGCQHALLPLLDGLGKDALPKVGTILAGTGSGVCLVMGMP
jgi:hypothetical protein